jgi:rubrerythrin
MGIFKKKRKITRKDMKVFRKSQQGELDAVLMYENLAKSVRRKRDKETFERLAKDEQRHADVFFAFTKDEDMKPKKAKSIAVPLLTKVLGRKIVYRVIAKAEYDAEKNYMPVVKKFPEVEDVKNDERHHGDAVLALLKKEK